MAQSLVALPCSRCGAVAVVFLPWEPDAVMRGLLPVFVKLASLKYGERLELPKGGNLFDVIPLPALSASLELTCARCAAGGRIVCSVCNGTGRHPTAFIDPAPMCGTCDGRGFRELVASFPGDSLAGLGYQRGGNGGD